MHFTEVETKYRANDISVEDFVKACREMLSPSREVHVKSYDHYYTKRERFIRYRAGTRPQLTMKEKTADGNNYRRVECNLDLGENVVKALVDKFCAMLGFKENFSIYKKADIIWYERFNTVYYVVYEDETEQKELGRFIEIEMSEDYAWADEAQAWEELLAIEKQLSSIGLTAQRRVRKSLFEMYRKI